MSSLLTNADFTFEPAEANRILKRLNFHYTPKHSSWLNMAEIEFSALKGQCLNRRIPDMVTMQVEVAAWEKIKTIVLKKLTGNLRLPMRELN